MAKKKAKAKSKPAAHAEVAGTFDELIRQSLTVKKRPKGWPKR
jgi:hypothetical protein